MNKDAYRVARRLIRDNGMYALQWLTDDHAAIMDVLGSQLDDPLETRAAIVTYSARAGLDCSVRKTATLDLLARFGDIQRKPAKGHDMKKVTIYSADNYDSLDEAQQCGGVYTVTIAADTSNRVILALAQIVSQSITGDGSAVCVMVDGVELEDH